jgi:hypothetical protein
MTNTELLLSTRKRVKSEGCIIKSAGGIGECGVGRKKKN